MKMERLAVRWKGVVVVVWIYSLGFALAVEGLGSRLTLWIVHSF